jgi:tRNA threonylcarbamoyladenosine biosynthesis protein TsaE
MFTFRSHLPSPEATAAFAAALAPRLRGGDAILLSGTLGAGKSHFARALIRARLGDPGAEVPSPTFTLVQSYEADGVELWHADLYRLSSPEEVIETGLDEAFQTAICLVEWPDRLGDLAPPDALSLTLEMAQGDARRLVATGPARWAARLEGLVETGDA